jgi:hypothetical protein
MYIQNYQIHNVLNVYQKQLTQRLANGKPKSTMKSQVISQHSYRRNRQKTIEKVTSDILNKINVLDKDIQSGNKFKSALQHEVQKEKKIDYKNSKDFSFNVIDQNNQKVTSSITVDNSKDLIYRLDKLIKNEHQNDHDKNIDLKA